MLASAVRISNDVVNKVVKNRHERGQDNAKYGENLGLWSTSKPFESDYNAVRSSATVFQHPCWCRGYLTGRKIESVSCRSFFSRR